MRVLLSSLTGALFLLAVAIPFATSSCSSGNAAPSPDGGGGGGGGGGMPDVMNAPEGSTNCGTSCYQPLGCDYQVTPPTNGDGSETNKYTNFSLDTSTGAAGTPLRVRLGLGGGTTMGKTGYADPTTTAAFTWETSTFDSNAKVKIGTSPTSLTEIHTGYSFSSNTLNIHEAHVCGLTPATTYYYAVGGGATASEVWSATQSFTTVPKTGSITIGIYGDARDSASVWEIVNERMQTRAVNMDLISGDIVLLGILESEWTQWLDAIWDPATEKTAGVPPSGSSFLTLGQQLMVPIAGNHEEEAADFYANWAIPGSGAWAKTYASFNVGNTHFVMFDDSPLSASSSPLPASWSPEATAQIAWLKSDLAAADANRTSVPFSVVISHRGIFSTSNHSQDPDVLLVRAVLAPIYDTYHVDLALNGHDHEYERSHPLNANATDPGGNSPVIQTNTTMGTTYVINAGAGAGAYAVDTTPEAYRALSWEFDYSTGYVGCYGILELEGNTLKMTEYGIKGAASADTMVDTFTLTR
jgi:acid phosphatase type 7